MTTSLTHDACKARLTLLWFGLSGLLFAFMMLYTIRGVPFGPRTVEVWAWIMPNIMPTLTLIVSVLVLDSKGKGLQLPAPSPFLFWLAMVLSLVYLVTLLILVVVPANFTDQPPLDLLRSTGVWLGPFQGLVSGALGGFFVLKPESPRPA
jgi:hypothetical protein